VRRGTEGRPAPNGYPAKLLPPTSALRPQHGIGIGDGVRIAGRNGGREAPNAVLKRSRYRSAPALFTEQAQLSMRVNRGPPRDEQASRACAHAVISPLLPSERKGRQWPLSGASASATVSLCSVLLGPKTARKTPMPQGWSPRADRPTCARGANTLAKLEESQTRPPSTHTPEHICACRTLQSPLRFTHVPVTALDRDVAGEYGVGRTGSASACAYNP
jgi:hypothetical protein